jgi:excinuclease UvrABC helicase subunit UvrB
MTESDDDKAKSEATAVKMSDLKNIDREIKRLTKEMKAYAADLEFEKAMKCRDEIKRLETARLTIE